MLDRLLRGLRPVARLALAIAIVTSGACRVIAGIEDVSPLPPDVSSATSMGSGAGSGGTEAASTGGAAGAAGGGAGAGALCPPDRGGGGAASCAVGLDPSGLVVQYWLDECASRVDASSLEDTAPSPLPLAIDFGGNASWQQQDGLWGIHWAAAGAAGVASAAMSAGKNDLLLANDSGTFTIELVVELDDAPVDGGGVLLAVDDAAGAHRLALTWSPPSLELWFGATEAPRLSWNQRPAGRSVVHLVVETATGYRAWLHLDGSDKILADSGGTFLLNLDLPASGNDVVRIGNDASESRSFRGAVSYAAIYDDDFPQSRVEAHAAALAASDDCPR